jgi:catechol 2,3-dioxygenase-like lactoylglutathione lyase family enzyme
MIYGAHVILFSTDADADREFFADVLGFTSVDAGGGWLIFALPPSELAVHPDAENGRHELFFMSDDLDAEIARLEEKGIHCADVHEEMWGRVTSMTLPGGSEVCLYEPTLPSPVTPGAR